MAKDFIHCPCGSGADYKICCTPYLNGEKNPPTPEALMRSRYTAYVKANLDYIEATMRGPALMRFNRYTDSQYSPEWIELQVITAYGDQDPDVGYVEFVAKYKYNNQK